MSIHTSRSWVSHGPYDGVDLSALVERPAWHDLAACRSRPDLSWFPARGQPVTDQVAVCRTCPVVAECRDYALAHSPTVLSGIWGAMTDRARRQARRRIRMDEP